jgi:hypothetical protein
MRDPDQCTACLAGTLTVAGDSRRGIQNLTCSACGAEAARAVPRVPEATPTLETDATAPVETAAPKRSRRKGK